MPVEELLAAIVQHGLANAGTAAAQLLRSPLMTFHPKPSHPYARKARTNKTPTERLFDHTPLACIGEGPADTIAAIRSGLPVVAIRVIADVLQISAEQLSMDLALGKGAFSPRRRRRLSTTEGDRVVRASIAFLRAAEVLGDEDAAGMWIVRPNRALGGVSPLSLLDTGTGYELVIDTLGRVEYGVFA